MLTIAIISLVLLVIFFIITLVRSNKSKDPNAVDSSYFLGILSGGCVIVSVFSFMDYIDPTPIALDVYRNKTALVIKYELRDSVMTPIDSTVVFENYDK